MPTFRHFYGPSTRNLTPAIHPLRIVPVEKELEIYRARKAREAMGYVVKRLEGAKHKSRLKRMADDIHQIEESPRRTDAIRGTSVKNYSSFGEEDCR